MSARRRLGHRRTAGGRRTTPFRAIQAHDGRPGARRAGGARAPPREPDVVEAEAFVAANGQLLARLAYASHLPSNGVEEPKSTESYGIGLQVVFRGRDGPRLGFGAEPSDLSPAGVERALVKARQGAVHDPAFVSLPRAGPERRTLAATMTRGSSISTTGISSTPAGGWSLAPSGPSPPPAASPSSSGSDQDLRRLGLLLGGDVTIVQERLAVVSTHLPEVQTDESTLITAATTGMVETMDAKGSGWSTGTRLDDFTDEAGVEAAHAAIRALGGERVPSGRYRVILGPQPVTDLLNNLVLPALHALELLLVDHAVPRPLRPARRRPDPLDLRPRRPTRLHGLEGHHVRGSPDGPDRPGQPTASSPGSSRTGTRRSVSSATRTPARSSASIRPPPPAGSWPRNGFRFATGGGRSFASPPGMAATNVFVEGDDGVSLDELCRRVGDGLYVGRIWYTYPINGLQAGDFTCTVIGDSYLIRDGRIAVPLRANAVRISDNITSVLDGVVGVTSDLKGTTVWGGDEVVYAPSIAVARLQVDAIAGFVETL